MDKKIKYGQFYTTNSKYIIGNLLNDIPKNIKVIEPLYKHKLPIFQIKLILIIIIS